MKTLSHTIILIALATGISSAATNSKLLGEMEGYVRDLIRAHPEVIGKKKKKDASEEMVKNAGQRRVFELTEDQAKNLRRRKEMVKDSQFKASLNKMKSLNSKDPEITFLIKYAEQDRIKAVEKLLAYRLLEINYTKAAAKVANERSTRMASILKQYSDYKAANNKPPASLDDLDLPEEQKKFINSKGEKLDWIYIGHLGPRLKSNNSHVVLIEPEPQGDARICGLDNGVTARFKNESIEGSINKIVESMKNGTTKEASKKPQAGKKTHPSMAGLKSLMTKYLNYKKANDGKGPDSLDSLDLTSDEKQYTSPASGEKADWIYFGDKSKMKVSKDVKIVIIAPKATGGMRMVGLSDGRVAAIKDSDIAPKLKK